MFGDSITSFSDFVDSEITKETDEYHINNLKQFRLENCDAVVPATEGIIQILTSIINWIIKKLKDLWKYITDFAKWIWKKILDFIGINSDDEEKEDPINATTEKKAEETYEEQEENTKHDLDEAAKQIFSKITKLPKKELMTKDEITSLVKLHTEVYNNMTKFLNDLWSDENEETIDFREQSILKWMIDRNKISLDGLPNWLQDQLRKSDGYSKNIEIPKRSLSEYLENTPELRDNIFNSKYEGKNILNKYYEFGKLIKEKVKEDQTLFENTLETLDSLDTAILNKNSNQANNNSDFNIQVFNKSASYITFQLFRLIQYTSTNMMVLFNEIFKIFEANLKKPLKDIITRIKLGKVKSNDLDFEKIRQIKTNMYVEHVPVYTIGQINQSQNSYSQDDDQDDDPYLASIHTCFNTTFTYVTVSNTFSTLDKDVQTFILYHEYGHLINHHAADKMVLSENHKARYHGINKSQMSNKTRMLLWRSVYRPIKNELQADVVGAEHSSPEAGLKFFDQVIKHEKLNVKNYPQNERIRRSSRQSDDWFYSTRRRLNDIFSRREFFKRWVETGVKPRTNFE